MIRMIIYEVFSLSLCICSVLYSVVCMFNVLTSELRVRSRHCDSTSFLDIGGSL